MPQSQNDRIAEALARILFAVGNTADQMWALAEFPEWTPKNRDALAAEIKRNKSKANQRYGVNAVFLHDIHLFRAAKAETGLQLWQGRVTDLLAEMMALRLLTSSGQDPHQLAINIGRVFSSLHKWPELECCACYKQTSGSRKWLTIKTEGELTDEERDVYSRNDVRPDHTIVRPDPAPAQSPGRPLGQDGGAEPGNREELPPGLS